MICQASDGSVLRRWPAHTAIVSDLQYLGSSPCLLSSGFDGLLRMWSANDLRLLDEVNHNGG